VAAPVSTIDFAAPAGPAIVVEHRAAEEVTSFAGVPVAAAGSGPVPAPSPLAQAIHQALETT